MLEVMLALDYLGSLMLFPLSYYSYKAYRVTRIQVFSYLFLGFTLLASGTFSHGLALTLLALSRHARPSLEYLALISTAISMIAETLAYLLIALGYANVSRVVTAAVLPLLRRSLPLSITLDFIDTLLLTYIAFSAFTIYSSKRERTSLVIALSFTLLLAAHILQLASMLLLSKLLLTISRLSYFSGLAVLLYLTAEVGRAR